MPTKLKVYVNEDDALLFWSISTPIPGCRGFAINRRRKTGGAAAVEGFLANRIGFDNAAAPAETEEGQEAVTRPSTEWPFQRFSWTDHEANTGDTVSYQVIPVVRNAAGDLELKNTHASPWSADRILGTTAGSIFKPFFNRGFVISQFMARFLAERGLTLAQFKQNIRDQDDRTIRRFLSGDLRTAILDGLLGKARTANGHVYAALFELSDDELVTKLCELGDHAHVVLSNGSVKKRADETTAEARTRDENEDARARLIAAGVDVDEEDRFLSPGPLGHNKFLVRTAADGRTPIAAWTGSTNWATTGLCTQVNNGLLIEDVPTAQVYLDQWDRLRAEKSGFSKPFIAENSVPKALGDDTPGTVRSVVWFTRTKGGVDMEALRAEVERAREGILFLMFMPGGAGLFSTVAARSGEPNLYVRGVVSELPNGRDDDTALDVNLIDGNTHTSLHLDIIQPEGIQHPFANFAAEVTHKQFIREVGHAIVHSKVVVIDPFSADPVVITGSHNFSGAASSKNDENFIIVKGDPALAEAYAVNILGAYAHYRWRVQLATAARPFNGLKDDDTWQAPMLAARRRDLQFWGV